MGMVLTPDQKRRIAELDSRPVEEEKQSSLVEPVLLRLKEKWLKFRKARWLPFAFKTLVILFALCIGGYYIKDYQLHRINFKEVLSTGPGNPLDNLISAVKKQKKKTELIEQARSQFVLGEYAESLATADSVVKMDGKDERAQNLIDLSADAATQRATRELDSGEIENALADARLALKYRPEHEEARQLSLRIGERLFNEARVHYSKNEYPQLIKKVKEVIKINPSDVAASELLLRTNNELLTQADEFFIGKKYFNALERVRLALQIDPTNTRALRLFNQIAYYIETPEIRLRGITKFGKGLYAVVQLPGSNQTTYLKEGETIRNFKLVDIDPNGKTAKFMQVYTKSEFTISLSKRE